MQPTVKLTYWKSPRYEYEQYIFRSPTELVISQINSIGVTQIGSLNFTKMKLILNEIFCVMHCCFLVFGRCYSEIVRHDFIRPSCDVYEDLTLNITSDISTTELGCIHSCVERKHCDAFKYNQST